MFAEQKNIQQKKRMINKKCKYKKRTVMWNRSSNMRSNVRGSQDTPAITLFTALLKNCSNSATESSGTSKCASMMVSKSWRISVICAGEKDSAVRAFAWWLEERSRSKEKEGKLIAAKNRYDWKSNLCVDPRHKIH